MFLVAETAVRTQQSFPIAVGLFGAAAALAQLVQAEVPRHGHYPRHGLALAAVGLRGLVYVHVAVVQDVLGVLPVFKYGEGIGEHRAAGAAVQHGESVPVAHGDALYAPVKLIRAAHARRLRFHFVCGGQHRIPPFVLLYTYIIHEQGVLLQSE